MEINRGATAEGSPLHWWRAAGSLSQHEVDQLRAMLQGIAILSEPCWPTAASGGAIAAIEMVLRALVSDPPAPLILELACSAVFLTAIEGSMAGADALAHLRRHFAPVKKDKRSRAAGRPVRGGHHD